MSKGNNNLTRMLGRVVALDAWAEIDDARRRIFNLFMDVTFSDDVLGREPGSNVRFRLRIKEAIVIMRIPASEKAKILPQSVVRDTPRQSQGKRVVEKSVSGEISGEASCGVKGVTPQIGVGAQAKGQMGIEEKEIREEDLISFQVLHRARPDGGHEWTVAHPDGVLEGKPWEGDQMRRAQARITGSEEDVSRIGPPLVIFEVKCRREHLDIHDIEIREEKEVNGKKARHWINPFARKDTDSKEPKEIAAIAYIRNKLMEIGLEVENIVEDGTAFLALADFAVPLDMEEE